MLVMGGRLSSRDHLFDRCAGPGHRWARGRRAVTLVLGRPDRPVGAPGRRRGGDPGERRPRLRSARAGS